MAVGYLLWQAITHPGQILRYRPTSWGSTFQTEELKWRGKNCGRTLLQQVLNSAKSEVWVVQVESMTCINAEHTLQGRYCLCSFSSVQVCAVVRTYI